MFFAPVIQSDPDGLCRGQDASTGEAHELLIAAADYAA
jgi:hypothetical protein